MATRTQSRTSNRTSVEPQQHRQPRSAAATAAPFRGATAPARSLGAALAGAAIGFAANLRPQGARCRAWKRPPATGTRSSPPSMTWRSPSSTRCWRPTRRQTFKRKMLLMKLTHALDKHAHQEEMVVYPALREANEAADADQLEGEHGYIKTFIYELNEMGPDAPNWLEKVREFRALVSEHAHMEEEQVFPRFKQDMTEEQNAQITSLVNRDGFWMA